MTPTAQASGATAASGASGATPSPGASASGIASLAQSNGGITTADSAAVPAVMRVDYVRVYASKP